MAGYALQFGINLIIRRSRNLVRRHHRDVMPQEILIQGSDFGAGCTIHKHRVEDIHPDNLIVQYLHRRRHALFFQFLAVMGKVDSRTGEHCLVPVGDSHDFQVQSPFLLQAFLLAVYLVYQAMPHRTDAANEKVQHLVFGKKKRIVDDIQGLAERTAFYHKRNIGLRRTLRTGYHVNAVPPQRTEELSGNARRMLHVFTHNSYRSKPSLGFHRADFAHFDFLGELFIEHLAGKCRIFIAHADRSRVFRRSLRYEEHTDAVLRQSFEDAVVHADNAYHTQSGHRNEARVVDRRNTLDGFRRMVCLLLHDSARSIRIECILY